MQIFEKSQFLTINSDDDKDTLVNQMQNKKTNQEGKTSQTLFLYPWFFDFTFPSNFHPNQFLANLKVRAMKKLVFTRSRKDKGEQNEKEKVVNLIISSNVKVTFKS